MSLTIQNLSYKKILSQLDLIVDRGEMVVVIGPNGAGKSTLLRLIAGVIAQKNSSIVLDGIDLNSISVREKARLVSYLPQMDSVADMSVLDLLETGRRARSGAILDRVDRQKIDSAIERFGLAHLLDKNLMMISGGERQKANIAAALLEESPVLLLDEPISWLDPKNQIEILNTIRTATKARELITIVVLHDLTLALNYADRVVMMKGGRKIHDTLDPQEVMLEDLYGIKVSIASCKKGRVVCYL